MSQVDRTEGLVGNTAFKAPVQVATTVNITLNGEQAIDGVAVVTDDRVLVKDQTDATQNGIWVCDTGDWNRGQDFDGALDVAEGTLLMVLHGSTNGNTYWRVTTLDPVEIETSDIDFALAFGTDSTLMQYLANFTGSVTRSVANKFGDEISITDAMTAAEKADARAGTLLVDVTAKIQKAIDSGAMRVVCPSPGQYYLNGIPLVVNQSNFELVIEAGASLVKGNSGATINVGSVAGTYSNIKITGKGRIRPSVVPHSVSSAGIIVGAAGVTVDRLVVDVDIIDMGQYGIASGNSAATITKFAIPDGVMISVNPTGAWFGGGSVAQAFDFNVPSGTNCSGKIGAAHFKITDGAGATDAFKWTGFTGTITGATFEGGSATVMALSQATNFVVSGVKLVKTYNGGAGMVIGTTSTAGQVTGVDAKTTTTTIPMFYFGAGSTCTGIQVSDFRTGGVIGAGATAACSNCDLRSITATGGGIDFSSLGSFSDGVIAGNKTNGRIYVKGNDNTVRDNDVSMGGAAVEGIALVGNDNRSVYNTVRDSTTSGVTLTGNANLLHELTADNCAASATVASGTSNVIGQVTRTNASGAVVDNGTTTIMPDQTRTALTGSVTVAAGSNPTHRTKIVFSALSGATTITNITGAANGDWVTLINEDGANNVTLDRSNSVLSGGANAVLGQYDAVTVQLVGATWHGLGPTVANS